MSTRLVAETGRTTGTSSSRRLRAEGKIPAVLYGRGAEAVPIAVDGRALRAALSTDQKLNAVLTIVVGATEHMALAKDIQRHLTRHVVTHVDFFAVSKDDIVAVDVPVVLVGDEPDLPPDALVNIVANTLAVKAKPADIPNAIEVDQSTFEVGVTVTVSDLTVPDGVTIDLDPDAAVVVVSLAAAEVTEAEAAEEGAEGEGADAAAGEGGGATPDEG